MEPADVGVQMPERLAVASVAPSVRTLVEQGRNCAIPEIG